MTSGALFGNSSALGGSSGGNKHLVEFRAGRMTLKGRVVHPDKRKGLLYVYQGEDSLMHFCWKDRTTGEIEDDLLIFPDDCEFVRVPQCTTGRVYVLKFKSFTRKYFFWMQEPKSEKDDEFCRRINEVLNNPPTAGSTRGGGGSGAPDGELQNLLNKMSQQQLMQLFGGVGQMGGLSSLLGTMGGSSGSSSRASLSGTGSSRGGSTGSATTAASGGATVTRPTSDTPRPKVEATPTPASTTAPASGNQGQVFLSDLQKYFSNLGTAPEGAVSTTEPGADVSPELPAALASSEVESAANSAAIRLTPHLPTALPGTAPDDLRTTLHSPQFAQAVSLFSNALTSGQLGPVIPQFGLGSEAAEAATRGNIQDFFKAIENESSSDVSNPTPKEEGDSKKKDTSSDEKPKPNKDGDEAMSLD